MERLQIDFAMQRGHEMIIRRDPPIARADLDEVDLQMLQAVRPPGLLAVDWFEMDGCVTFRHAVDGRKMLPHRLIAGPFGMKEYLGLMLGIVEALDNCGHHLLRESCCLLEEKFLFIGAEWRDVALTYLPLREPPVKKPVREELIGLAVRLLGKAERVDGEAVQIMLRMLDDPAVSWPSLRLGLLSLMTPDRRFGDEQPRANMQGFRFGSSAGQPDANVARGNRTASNAGWPDADGVRENRIASNAGQPDADGARANWTASNAGWPEAGSGRTHRTASDAGGSNAGERYLANGARSAGAGSPESAPAWQPDSYSGVADGELSRAEEDGTKTGIGKNRFEFLAKFFRGDGPAEVPPQETLMLDDREWPGVTGRLRDTGRARWLSGCGAVLATALIWRYIYLPSPGTDRLLISLGATLLAAGGLVLMWRRLSPGSREMFHDERPVIGAGAGHPDGAGQENRRPEAAYSIRTADASAGVQTDEAEIRFPWLVEFGRDGRPASNATLPTHAGESGSGWNMDVGVEADAGPPGDALPGTAANEETGLLQDETVLLGSHDGALWLVREYEGSCRRFPLEPGSQVIGRSEAHARIVDTAEGVSRAHLEIAFDGSEVRIKDLASRNGTLLGGEIMVPYKEYVLGDGGEFRLAGPDGPKYTLRKSG